MVSSSIGAHLEQISACSQTLSQVNFTSPKLFVNALLLRTHDITTLIRDTEAHERALFSVPSSTNAAGIFAPESGASRRSMVYHRDASNVNRSTMFPTGPVVLGGTSSLTGVTRAPRRNTAVAAVLGGHMVEKIRRGGGGPPGTSGAKSGEVDVDILLEGAEKLCGVYPILGALDRINSLRDRHTRLRSSMAYYEQLAAEQAEQLSKISRPNEFGAMPSAESPQDQRPWTQDDLLKDEAEIRELEKRKRELEDRVQRMDDRFNF